MAKKQKYYVVWEGVNPGIYKSWDECKLQIQGYPNAQYKSYKSLEMAERAFHDGPEAPESKNRQNSYDLLPANIQEKIIIPSISVDAAFNGKTKAMEYRGVHTKDGLEIFRSPVYTNGTNNIGEYMALIHGMALLKQKKIQTDTIYSDSKTAISWVRDKELRTTLNVKTLEPLLLNHLKRAHNYLLKNEFDDIRILKWETKEWGEIPADFDRK